MPAAIRERTWASRSPPAAPRDSRFGVTIRGKSRRPLRPPLLGNVGEKCVRGRVWCPRKDSPAFSAEARWGQRPRDGAQGKISFSHWPDKRKPRDAGFQARPPGRQRKPRRTDNPPLRQIIPRGWKKSLGLTASRAIVSPARQIKAINQTNDGPVAQSWTGSSAFASPPPCGPATPVSALPPRLRRGRG
jgi:hypothetical protein